MITDLGVSHFQALERMGPEYFVDSFLANYDLNLINDVSWDIARFVTLISHVVDHCSYSRLGHWC